MIFETLVFTLYFFRTTLRPFLSCLERPTTESNFMKTCDCAELPNHSGNKAHVIRDNSVLFNDVYLISHRLLNAN
jgi:hypothetical protein